MMLVMVDFSRWIKGFLRLVRLIMGGIIATLKFLLWLLSVAVGAKDKDEELREEDHPDFNHRTGVRDGFSDPQGCYDVYKL